MSFSKLTYKLCSQYGVFIDGVHKWGSSIVNCVNCNLFTISISCYFLLQHDKCLKITLIDPVDCKKSPINNFTSHYTM